MRVTRTDAGIAVGFLSCLLLFVDIQAVGRALSVAGWFVAGKKSKLCSLHFVLLCKGGPFPYVPFFLDC